jgi:hypothetical protein
MRRQPIPHAGRLVRPWRHKKTGAATVGNAQGGKTVGCHDEARMFFFEKKNQKTFAFLSARTEKIISEAGP